MCSTNQLMLAPPEKRAKPSYPRRALRRFAPIALSLPLWLGACGPSLSAVAASDAGTFTTDFISTPRSVHPPDHGLTPAEVRRNEAAWRERAAAEPAASAISLTPREHATRLAGAIVPAGDRELVSAIRTRTRSLVRCFEAALRDTPGLAGRFVIELELGQAGTLRVTIDDDDMGHDGLGRCVTNVLRTVPAPTDGVEPGTRWRYPLFFAGPTQVATGEDRGLGDPR